MKKLILTVCLAMMYGLSTPGMARADLMYAINQTTTGATALVGATGFSSGKYAGLTFTSDGALNRFGEISDKKDLQ